MAVLEVQGLRVRYASGGPEILKGVSFQVESDDFLALIGPSGAGQSTLIRCVHRLVEPSSGSIRLLGEEIMKLKKRDLRMMRRNVGRSEERRVGKECVRTGRSRREQED